MGRYIGGRLAQSVPITFVASVLVFGLVRLLPGDTAIVLAGPNASPATLAAIRAQLGLEKPLPLQYLLWIEHLARGDLGASQVSGFAVRDLILQRAPATIELAFAGLLIAVVVALPAGVLAALNRGRAIDVLVSSWSGLALAVPTFWFGIIAIIVFAVMFGLLPPGGFVAVASDPLEGLKYLVLPAVSLALNQSAVLARFVRSSVSGALGEDFVRTAEAMGVPGARIVIRHVLPNALIPIVTVLGIQFGQLLSGAIVIEAVFAWPGVGSLLVDAVNSRDYPVIQGVMAVLVLGFILVNLATDVAYGFLDPRIRLEGR